MVNKRYYLGIQNRISNRKYLFFADCDISLMGKMYNDIVNYFKNANLLIYKTLNGYHIVSLNFYSPKNVECLYDHLRFNLDCIDRDFYKYARLSNFTTTIRINRKPNEERKLIHWQWGMKCNKIHKQYYEIFNAMLNNKLTIGKGMLKKSRTSLIGYIWDLDISKKWTFEKVINGTNIRNNISQH